MDRRGASAEAGAVELAARVRSGDASPSELVEDALARIEATDEHLRSFLIVDSKRARDEARRATRDVERHSELGALHGIPIAIKDLQQTAGLRTTFGSLAYSDYVPTQDCEAVARLRRAGAIVVGKTNTPFMGMLGETKNRLGPDCRNPWDLERTPGGSSGGSAVAVMAGLVPLATGTDSAGSITVPAGYTGAYGFKPTHGRVPTVPVPGDSLQFLDSGPLARSVVDAALMLSVMAGFDCRDPVSLSEPAGDLEAAAQAPTSDRPLAGMRVAYSKDLGHFRPSREVSDATARAARTFADLGAEVEEVSPEVPEPFEIYMPIYHADLRAVLGADLARFRDDLFPEAEREMAKSPEITTDEYVKQFNRLLHFRAAMRTFFADFDLLLTPCATTTAFPLGQPPEIIDGVPVSSDWTSFMPFQISWNMTGQPAASIQCELSSAGLPIGLLIVGRHECDLDVLRASAAFECAQPPAEPPTHLTTANAGVNR